MGISWIRKQLSTWSDKASRPRTVADKKALNLRLEELEARLAPAVSELRLVPQSPAAPVVDSAHASFFESIGLRPLPPQSGPAAQQLVYLDFQGAKAVNYNGPLVVTNLDVPVYAAPAALRGQEASITATVTSTLNADFAGLGVTFTTDAPGAAQPHSTVYVGGTDAPFAPYGSFLGLAEAVDVGNRNPNDNAFVFSDRLAPLATSTTAYVQQLTGTVAHETGHLLGYEHLDAAAAGPGPLADVADVAATLPGSQFISAGPQQTGGGQSLVTNPSTVSGAIIGIAVNPLATKILYVSTANGGVWKTSDITAKNTAGDAFPIWTPLTDSQATLSVTALAFDAAASKAAYGTAAVDGTKDVLYGGTGNVGSANVAGPAIGILKTTDGGANWSVKGYQELKDLKITAVLATQYRDSTGLHSVLLVATRANTSGATHGDPARVGVWRSTDGGDTWTHVSDPDGGPTASGLAAGDVTDLKAVRDPAVPDSSLLYAASIGNATSVGAGVYESADGGATWKNVTKKPDGSTNILGAQDLKTGLGTYDLPAVLPFSIKLDTYATGDNAHTNAVTRVYAGITTDKVLQRVIYWDNRTGSWQSPLDTPASVDGGVFYNLDPGGQANLHFSIAADPTTANRLFLGGDRQPVVTASSVGVTDYVGRVFRIDPTANFTPQITAPLVANQARGTQLIGNQANNTGPHADSRLLVFDVAGTLYEGDDGGIYRLDNPEAVAGIGATAPKWTSLNGNLQITEVGSVAFDPLNQEAVVGSQDTGVQKQTTANASPWTSFSKGDGSTTLVSVDGDRTYVYSLSNTLVSFQRRVFDSSNNQVGGTVGTSNGLLTGITTVDKNKFLGSHPVVVNAVNPAKLLLGFNQLYQSADRGGNLTVIDDITGSGFFNLTPTADGPTANFPIEALAFGGYNPDGSKNDLVIYESRGGALRAFNGVSWTAPALTGAAVTQITVDPKNWKAAYATTATGKVFATADGGGSWTNLTDPNRGGTGLPTQKLTSVQLVPIDAPDLHFHLLSGQDFDVSLRGAKTLNDVKQWIEAQAPKKNGTPLVQVTLKAGAVTVTTRSFNFEIKDDSSKSGTNVFAITAVGDSSVVAELGLGSVAVRAQSILPNFLLNLSVIHGSVLTVPAAGPALAVVGLNTVTNAKATTGIHRSPGSQDILLVGGDQGVFRVVNPVGDPSVLVTYPAVGGAATPVQFQVKIPGDNNDLLVTALTPGADLNTATVTVINHGATGPAKVSWDPVTQNLIFDVPSTATAADVLRLVNGPDVSAMTATDSATAGQLLQGTYQYKVSIVSAAGVESNLSDAKAVAVAADFHSVTLAGIPTGPTGSLARRIYRTSAGSSTFDLIATIADNTTATFTDLVPDRLQTAAPNVAAAATTAVDGGTGGKLAANTYRYKFSFVDGQGVESQLSDAVTTTAIAANHLVTLTNVPLGPTGTAARRVYRAGSADDTFVLVATLNDNATFTFADRWGAAVDVTVADGTRPAKPTGVTATVAAGGRLAVGTYKYRVTILDATGVESNAADEVTGAATAGNQTVKLTGLAARTTPGTVVRVYRSQANGTTFNLIATLTDLTVTQFVDTGAFGFDPAQVKDASRPTAPNLTSGAVTGSAVGNLAKGTYAYRTTFLDAKGVESNASAVTSVTAAANNSQIGLVIPAAPTGAVGRRIYRSDAGGPFVLVGSINDNTTLAFADIGAISDPLAAGTRAAFKVALFTAASGGDATTGAGTLDQVTSGQLAGGSASAAATATVVITGTLNDLKITAKANGDQFNGTVAFIITDKIRTQERVTWNAADRLLVFDISATTTAADVIAALTQAANKAASDLFKVELSTPDSGATNTGLGSIVGASGLTRVTSLRNLQWSKFGTNLPNALVSSLVYSPPQKTTTGKAIGDVLVVGLRGRGVWELPNAAATVATTGVLQLASNGDRIILALDPSRPAGLPQLLQVFQQNDPNVAAVLKGTFALSGIQQIKVTGTGANDTLQIDPRIRVAGGITFDGGGGTDTLVLPPTPGQFLVQKTGASTEGTLQVFSATDLSDRGLQINFVRTTSVQANLPPAQAALPAGDVKSQLLQVRDGLTFLTSPGAIDDALTQGLSNLPLIGTAYKDLLSGSLGPKAQVAISDQPGVTGTPSSGGDGGEDPGNNANTPVSPVLSLLLGTASGAFSLSDLGTTITTLEGLRAALDKLDTTPNNVVLTQTPGGFTIDLKINRTVTATTDLSVGTGSVALTSTAPVSADFHLHLLFGVDKNGFFLDTTPADEITVDNIKATGNAVTNGRYGLLAVTAPTTTVTIDPGVTFTADLKEPGPDPFTNVADHFIRTAEPIATPANLFVFSQKGPATKDDVTLSGTFAAAPLANGGPAPISLQGSLLLKWADINAFSNVVAAGSAATPDAATTAFLLFKDLTVQTVINGLTTAADTIQQKSQVDVLTATNVPLTSRPLYNILNNDKASLIFQASEVQFESETIEDATGSRFSIGLTGDRAGTPAELGIKVGDAVQFKATDGTTVTGSVESLDLDSISIKYAATDPRSPDEVNPYFNFSRSGALGDQIKTALGSLTNAQFVQANVFTLQDLESQLAAAQGIDITTSPELLPVVAVDPVTKTLSFTATLQPTELSYTEPLYLSSSFSWATFDATATLPVTVTSSFRIPLLVNMAVTPSTADSVFLSIDTAPLVQLDVTENVATVSARTLSGATLQNDPAAASKDAIAMTANYKLNLLEPGTDADKRASLTELQAAVAAPTKVIFQTGVQGFLSIPGLIVHPEVTLPNVKPAFTPIKIFTTPGTATDLRSDAPFTNLVELQGIAKKVFATNVAATAVAYVFTFAPPDVQISSVTVGSTGQATITGLSAFKALDLSGATVSIYYDDSTNGFHGTLIARLPAEQAATFAVPLANFAGLDAKPYYFYAVADDGVNPPVYSDYSGPVTPPAVKPVNVVPAAQVTTFTTSIVFSTAKGNAITVDATRKDLPAANVTLSVLFGTLQLNSDPAAQSITVTSDALNSGVVTYTPPAASPSFPNFDILSVSSSRTFSDNPGLVFHSTVDQVPIITSNAADVAVTTSLLDGSGNAVAFVAPGDAVQVKITATNVNTVVGTVKATSVKVTGGLPFGVTLGALPASVVASGTTTYDATTGIWTIGDLALGSSATLTLKATVNTDTRINQLVSTATITAAQVDFAPANNNTGSSVVLPVSRLVVVDNATDEVNAADNKVSLREAVNLANANPGQNYVIRFASTVTGTVTLPNGELTVTGNVTIVGPTGSVLTLSGGSANRIFNIQGGGSLTASDLTLTAGKATGANGFGGAILNAGNVTLTRVTVSSSTAAQNGGAISNTGNLFLDQVTLTLNTATANGGALASIGGSFTLQNSTVSSNTATKAGGGLFVQDLEDTITGSTIKDNTATETGGGIKTVGGHLTVTGTTLSNDKAPIGGGIYDDADGVNVALVDLSGDTFTTNKAAGPAATNRGGAIANYRGSLVRIDNSTFTGNTAALVPAPTGTAKDPSKAGAIYNGVGSQLVITRSTFADNKASRQSGAIDNPGVLFVSESTFSNNQTDGFGGAIDSKGRATVKSSTFSGNKAAGGAGIALFSTTTQDGTLYLGSSIVAGNTGGTTPDVSTFTAKAGAVRSLGYNVIGVGDPAVTWKTTDQLGTSTTILDAKLDTLKANGGTTMTFLPLAGSPAINKGSPNPGDATDQRGLVRVVGPASDAGAVETPTTVVTSSVVSGGTPSVQSVPQAFDAQVVTTNATSPDLAPAAVGTGPGTVTVAAGPHFVEGTAGSLSASFDDPGSTDDASAYTVTVDWGDNSPPPASPDATISGSGTPYTITGSHTYADEGTFSGTITITKNGVVSTLPFTAVVDDADALIQDTNSPATVGGVQGTSVTQVVLAKFDAPGLPGATAAGFTATITWGDKGTSQGTIQRVDPAAGSTDAPFFQVVGSHLYSEDDTFAVSVTVTDPGASQPLVIPVSLVIAEDPTFTVTAVPTITTVDGTVGGATLKEGAALQNVLLATFQHANGTEAAGDFLTTINWGDGTSSDSKATVTLVTPSDPTVTPFYEVRGSHTYGEDRSWAVSVKILDTVDTEQEPNSPPVTATTTVTVQEALPFTATGNKTFTSNAGDSLDNVLLATFSHANGVEDPAADFHATIDWGDQTPAIDPSTAAVIRQDSNTGTYQVFGSHVYNKVSGATPFTIAVSIADVSSTDDLPATPGSANPVLTTVNTDTATVTGTPPSITSVNHASFTAGTAGTFTVTTGASSPGNPALTETDNLPANSGITFADNGDGTATLAGTPAASATGNFTFTITANNGVAPNAVQTFTLNVAPAAADVPPTITSVNNASFTVGTAGTFTVTTGASSPANPALTETDNLPANSGVSFVDNGNGTATIAGTPNANAAGSFTFTITANNGVAPNAVQTFTLNVAPLVVKGPLAIATFVVPSTAVPNATVQLSATATDPGIDLATLTYAWTVTPPTGSALTLTGSTPSFVATQTGGYAVALTVTDADQRHDSKSATVTVAAVTADTLVSLVGNDLHVADVKPGGKADNLLISYDGANRQLVVTDPVNTVGVTIPGVTASDAHTVRVPLSAFTGNVVVDTANGDDTVAVQSTPAGRTVTVNLGSGNDTVNVGGPNNVLDGIQGGVFVVGGSPVAGSSDVLNVNDQAATGSQSYAVTSGTVVRGGAAPITYAALGKLVVNAGAGSDTVNVQSTLAATPVTVNGGPVANTFNVGSLAPAQGGVVDNIKGALRVIGSGNDTLNVDDTGSADAKSSGTLTQTALSGLNMGAGGIGFNSIANLNVRLGAGGAGTPNAAVGNTFTINFIDPLTHTRVDGGSSNNDTANVTFPGDFSGKLDLTGFEHGTVTVNKNFTGVLNDTLPGHLEKVTVLGSLASGGNLQAASIDNLTVNGDLAGTVTASGKLTSLTVGGAILGTGAVTTGGDLTSLGVSHNLDGLVSVGGNLGTATVGQNVGGTIKVTGTLATVKVGGDVSGTVGETGTVGQFTVSGSLTTAGRITAVNSTAALGNITSLSVGKDLCGTVVVSGTLSTLTVGGTLCGSVTSGGPIQSIAIGGSLTSPGVINAPNISPAFPVPLPPVVYSPPTSLGAVDADKVAFIRGLYHSVLDRDVEANGAPTTYWLNVYNTVQTNPQQLGLPVGTDPALYVARGFWESQEHRWDEIGSYYHNFLGRDLDLTKPQDVAARDYWANQFLFAGLKEADVIRGFVGSPEYLFHHRADTSLAADLNASLLAGAATTTDLQNWTTRLAALDAQRAAIKDKIFATPDAYKAALATSLGSFDDEAAKQGVLFDVLNSDTLKQRALDGFYSAFLRRTGTAAEKQALLSGRDAFGNPVDLGTIAEMMLASPQYRLNAAKSEV